MRELTPRLAEYKTLAHQLQDVSNFPRELESWKRRLEPFVDELSAIEPKQIIEQIKDKMELVWHNLDKEEREELDRQQRHDYQLYDNEAIGPRGQRLVLGESGRKWKKL